jgi:argininosuccinate lyase
VFGQKAGLMMAVRGLPSTYNKDLQESFEPMLDGTKIVAERILIATGVFVGHGNLARKDESRFEPGYAGNRPC